MMRESFRKDYVRNWPMRLLDAVLHSTISLLLTRAILLRWSPTGFALQWIPDIMLLVLWPYSMITGKYLEHENVFVKIHKAMHSMGVLFPLSIGFGVGTCMGHHDRFGILLACQLATHWMIDHFTHEGWEG